MGDLFEISALPEVGSRIGMGKIPFYLIHGSVADAVRWNLPHLTWV